MGDESQLAVSCSQVSYLVVGLESIQLSCWLRRSHGNSQIIQAVAKTKGCSLKIYSGVPMLWTMPTQFLNMEKSDWYLRGAICSSLLGAGRYTECYRKRNVDTKPHKTFDLQSVLSTKYAKAMVIQNLWH